MAPKLSSADLGRMISGRLDMLAQDVDETAASEWFREWMAVQARFHRYSWKNTMLILVQRPDATRVAGFHTWKKMGRWVKKDEEGIGIYRPEPYWLITYEDGETERKYTKQRPDAPAGAVVERKVWYKVAYVYDVAQTDGEPLPELDWRGNGRHAELEGALLAYAGELGLDVRLLADGSREVGGASVEEKRISYSTDGAVPITIIHELGHILTNGRQLSRDRSVRESVVEAVAVIVASHFGFECPESVNYILALGGDGEVLRESLDAISKTAKAIIVGIEEKI